LVGRRQSGRVEAPPRPRDKPSVIVPAQFVLDCTEEMLKIISFQEVTSAVVLFRSMAGNISNARFDPINLRLHALVAVGPDQLKSLLAKRPPRSGPLTAYKKDAWACEKSLALLH